MSKLETIKANLKKFGPIAIISLIVIGAIIVLIIAKLDQDGLTASGTIEAVQVKIAPQIIGQVLEVKVDEGDRVQQNDLLLKLDPSQLAAQLNQARSNLHQAQASYDLLVVGGSKEQRAAAIAAAERELIAAEIALEELFENSALIAATAQSKVAKAREVLDDEEHDWIINQPGNRASPEELKSAKAKVTVAEKRLNKRQKQYDAASGRTAKAQAQIALTEAIDDLQRAVWYLDWLEKGADEIEMAILDADVALAAANLEIAEAEYERVKDGPDPDDIALAEAAVKHAQAQLDLAQNDPGEEQLAVAQAQIDITQAAVELLLIQLDMTEILAPMDGTVLYRLIEPGELAVAGSPVVTLVQLDQLSLTVFLPEDQYGEISLGEYIPIKVDSFPSQTFIGEVIRIADRAEYTPRNVQTQEGRRTTVFAVELRIIDDTGKLKPGMPADANFESKIETK